MVSGTPVTATAQVIYGVEPYVVEYFVSSGAADPVFQFAGLGVTAPDYAVDLGSFVAGTYRLYALANDSAGVMAVTNSMTNTFMVADPIGVALATPADGATFDYLTSVEGAATVAGGIAPYGVQFYLDGVAHGAPVAAAPYAHDFGPLFVGDHMIQARVTDATGWASNSAAHTVHITGPVGVLLSPTNGSVFNYGQPLVLSAQAGGGTGPYVVSMYVNDQLVGTRSAPPFLVDLGVVPVGSYTCWAQVTDSSVPAQVAISDTNLITILENPLVATLTSPTNGQSAATNVGFTLTATVAVAAPVTVSGVEFFLDGVSVGVDDSAPYWMRVTTLTLGDAPGACGGHRQPGTAERAPRPTRSPLCSIRWPIDNFRQPHHPERAGGQRDRVERGRHHRTGRTHGQRLQHLGGHALVELDGAGHRHGGDRHDRQQLQHQPGGLHRHRGQRPEPGGLQRQRLWAGPSPRSRSRPSKAPNTRFRWAA